MYRKSPFLLLVLALVFAPMLSAWASVSSANEHCSSSCHEQMHESKVDVSDSSCTQHGTDCELLCQDCGSCHTVGMTLPVAEATSVYGFAALEYHYIHSLSGNISSSNFRPPRA